MRIWNLTPHTINYDDGETKKEFPSNGNLRVTQDSRPAEEIEGFRTVETKYGEIIGMPADAGPCDVLIVSSIVADALSRGDRKNDIVILVPDTGPSCKRDENGRIVSVCQFIRK